MNSEVDDKYMRRCISLARNGMISVSPNPMVGAVIVCDGRIIGEGFHRKYGEPHAEVNAINSVSNQSLLRKSTLYVNLEPCSHHGKTPPCAELIIERGIPRVIVGCLDPYPSVAGRGVKMLRAAGVEVITGVLEKESYELNKHFMVSHSLKRPFVSLKWAKSSDGFIDKCRTNKYIPPATISSPNMAQQIHKKRSEFDAIMVGTRTALLDNPSLTIRNWVGNSPVRVVLDRNLVIPSDYNLMDHKVHTIVFTSKEKENSKNITYVQLDYNKEIIGQVLTSLNNRNINSLLVEGGTTLIESFIKQDLWDEIQIETAPVKLHNGVNAPFLPEDNLLPQISERVCKNVYNLSKDNKGTHSLIVYSRENK